MANTTYFGGKSSPGTYQTIINQIPPHDVFVSGFLGHCSIMRHKKPAGVNIGCEIDPGVVADWDGSGLLVLNISFLSGEWLGYDTNTRRKYFLYLDPPYPLASRRSDKKVYKYELTDDQHIQLLQYLLKVRCDIALSTYPNDLYASYLKGWRYIDFESSTRHGMATERLYMNYPEPKELHDYSYLGKDYREREAIKKKHRSLTTKIAVLPGIERNKLFAELKKTYKM